MKKVLLAACLIFTSMASQAALISHYGYERESTSNIVKGGGLEWLMWDVTKGMSIESALLQHSADGWTLATNNNIADLFNSFKFGKTDWNNAELPMQRIFLPWTDDENSSHNKFMSLFGITYTDWNHCESGLFDCWVNGEHLNGAYAVYGDDTNGDGLHPIAALYDDRWERHDDANEGKYDHSAGLGGNHWKRDWSQYNIGVALVREPMLEPVAVHLPSSFSLLTLGLFASVFLRRKALHR